MDAQLASSFQPSLAGIPIGPSLHSLAKVSWAVSDGLLASSRGIDVSPAHAPGRTGRLGTSWAHPWSMYWMAAGLRATLSAATSVEDSRVGHAGRLGTRWAHQWSMYWMSAGLRATLSAATSVEDSRVHSAGALGAVLPLKRQPCEPESAFSLRGYYTH